MPKARRKGVGCWRLVPGADPAGQPPELLFCENETNVPLLFGGPPQTPYPKDGINDHVVSGAATVNPARRGTKMACWYRLTVDAGATVELRLRLAQGEAPGGADLGAGFERTFADRRREADEFYAALQPADASDDEAAVMRQAFAGMTWSQQFYNYDVGRWLEGDAPQPPPPEARRSARNAAWTHLYNRDIVAMPDKWEYPWYAAWDLAFHCVVLAHTDPAAAKHQMLLMCREWYMHPNGQLPAYEWNFGDVKDAQGNNIFGGGFLGLDNIGPFDRSAPLPGGVTLEQCDGTAWMAKFCLNMLEMALRLADRDRSYQDLALKFFEHSCMIAAALNKLWDEDEGFFYDRLRLADGSVVPVRARSMVGLLPLFTAVALPTALWERLPDFRARARWFIAHRSQLTASLRHFVHPDRPESVLFVNEARLRRVLERTVAPRLALTVATSPRASAGAAVAGRHGTAGLRTGRVADGAVRRQLQLARAGLVAAQLPGGRVAARAAQLLRQRLQGRAADRVGCAGAPRRRARRDPVPRIFPRRHRRGPGCLAPDGLDGAGGRAHRGPAPPRRRRCAEPLRRQTGPRWALTPQPLTR